MAKHSALSSVTIRYSVAYISILNPFEWVFIKFEQANAVETWTSKPSIENISLLKTIHWGYKFLVDSR